MSRILCLLFGLVLASLPLVDFSIHPNDPSPSDLILARGGDPGEGKGSGKCDEQTGVYIGCTMAGGFCRQCLMVRFDGDLSPTYVDLLSSTAPKGATGYMWGSTYQDCGNYYDGTCVVDATSPTGFSCESTDSKNSCSYGQQTVVPQSGGG